MTVITPRSLGLAAGMLATAGLTAGALIAHAAGARDVTPAIGAPAPSFSAVDIAGAAALIRTPPRA